MDFFPNSYDLIVMTMNIILFNDSIEECVRSYKASYSQVYHSRG